MRGLFFLPAFLVCCGVTAASADSPSAPVSIVYLTRDYAEPAPVSPLDPEVTDVGLQGARVGVDEINITGRFTGFRYVLTDVVVPKGGDIAAAAKAVLDKTGALIVADLEAPDLLAVADSPAARGAVILDARTSDDSLRQADCRSNVFHILPSWAMRADALGQFLVWKNWRKWFLLAGSSPSDTVYAEDLKRAAKRFGAKIVDERTYKYQVGAARATGGQEQIQEQIPSITQAENDYDVLVVADLGDAFGDYLLFNTWAARPVAGTQGLIAVAWHRSFEQYAAEEMQHRFHQKTGRDMTERDYGAWLGVSVIGEAVTRGGKTDVADIRDYLLSDRFSVSGFKGESLSFRRWDHQLRQPVLLTGPRMLVSISPQQGFLHPDHPTDTLGYDAPESACRMAK